MPSLGLSNKAIFKTSEAERGRSSELSGAAKNAFGDNIPTFVSVDLESKFSVNLGTPLTIRKSQLVHFNCFLKIFYVFMGTQTAVEQEINSPEGNDIISS